MALTAGMKVHERFFESKMLIFGKEIPCAHTEIINDFELEAGQSSTTMIESLSFRASEVYPAKGEKNVLFTLILPDKKGRYNMQLWHGGLMPGAEVYRFMAVDANYKA